VHRADAEAEIAKRLERQRAERGLLLGKHRGDLALRRAMNAGVGPAGVDLHRPADYSHARVDAGTITHNSW